MQSDTRLWGRCIWPPTCHRQLSFVKNIHTLHTLVIWGWPNPSRSGLLSDDPPIPIKQPRNNHKYLVALGFVKRPQHPPTMRFLLLFIVFSSFLLFSSSALATPEARNRQSLAPPAGTTIGFQAHSYNDLNEWVQLLKKGARYVKIDPQYQPQSFCQAQKQVANRTDQRGCFVLNHDDASTARDDYNTSSDILNMLNSPLFKPWFTQKDRLFIALCFKVKSIFPF